MKTKQLKMLPKTMLEVLFCLSLTIQSFGQDKPVTPQESEELIAKWVQLWASYDLDLLEDIFWNNPQCSYFSSEKEGLIEGYSSLIPHHEGFGFVSGGKVPAKALWLEDQRIALVGNESVVTAVWFFGIRENRDAAQKGPVTFVLVRNSQGKVRIAHTHFANYP